MSAINLNPAMQPASAVMPALSQDIMVLLFGALLVMAIAWAVRVKIRERDDRAIILLGCEVAACLLEGFACYLTQCYHSPIGEYRVNRAFDTDVPLWLAEVYVLLFGAAAYFLQKKSCVRQRWAVFAPSSL